MPGGYELPSTRWPPAHARWQPWRYDRDAYEAAAAAATAHAAARLPRLAGERVDVDDGVGAFVQGRLTKDEFDTRVAVLERRAGLYERTRCGVLTDRQRR